VRPRPVLTCTDCGRPMHAKVSGRGGRFFAHDRRSTNCAAAGETEEHRSLKRALAAAVRQAGHQAQLEVIADHGGGRADVLVTAPGGGLTALEARTVPRAGSLTCARRPPVPSRRAGRAVEPSAPACEPVQRRGLLGGLRPEPVLARPLSRRGTTARNGRSLSSLLTFCRAASSPEPSPQPWAPATTAGPPPRTLGQPTSTPHRRRPRRRHPHDVRRPHCGAGAEDHPRHGDAARP
jgi:hypothetical protein